MHYIFSNNGTVMLQQILINYFKSISNMMLCIFGVYELKFMKANEFPFSLLPQMRCF